MYILVNFVVRTRYLGIFSRPPTFKKYRSKILLLLIAMVQVLCIVFILVSSLSRHFPCVDADRFLLAICTVLFPASFYRQLTDCRFPWPQKSRMLYCPPAIAANHNIATRARFPYRSSFGLGPLFWTKLENTVFGVGRTGSLRGFPGSQAAYRTYAVGKLI